MSTKRETTYKTTAFPDQPRYGPANRPVIDVFLNCDQERDPTEFYKWCSAPSDNPITASCSIGGSDACPTKLKFIRSGDASFLKDPKRPLNLRGFNNSNDIIGIHVVKVCDLGGPNKIQRDVTNDYFESVEAATGFRNYCLDNCCISGPMPIWAYILIVIAVLTLILVSLYIFYQIWLKKRIGPKDERSTSSRSISSNLESHWTASPISAASNKSLNSDSAKASGKRSTNRIASGSSRASSSLNKASGINKGSNAPIGSRSSGSNRTRNRKPIFNRDKSSAPAILFSNPVPNSSTLVPGSKRSWLAMSYWKKRLACQSRNPITRTPKPSPASSNLESSPGSTSTPTKASCPPPSSSAESEQTTINIENIIIINNYWGECPSPTSCPVSTPTQATPAPATSAQAEPDAELVRRDQITTAKLYQLSMHLVIFAIYFIGITTIIGIVVIPHPSRNLD